MLAVVLQGSRPREQHNRLQLQIVGRRRRRLRREVPARRVTQKRDLRRIALILHCVRLHPPNRCIDVLETSRPVMSRREAIVDREPGEVAIGQRPDEWFHSQRLVAATPAAAMYDDGHRKRSRPIRHAGIQLLALAVDVRVFNIRSQFRSAGPRTTPQQRYHQKEISKLYSPIVPYRRRPMQVSASRRPMPNPGPRIAIDHPKS
jgi:hypothetical protein